MILCSCVEKYTKIENAVYFYDAQVSEMKKIATDDQERHFQVPIRASKVVDATVQIDLEVDADYLADYNEENGTKLMLLPESVYSLTSFSTEIEAGEINADQITLTVSGFSQEMMDSGNSYALPLKLVSSSSECKELSGSEKILYICDPVIVASAPVLTCRNETAIDFDEPFSLSNWTLEAKVRKTGLSDEMNVFHHVIFMLPCDGPNVFIAFGDMGNQLNTLQVKNGTMKVRSEFEWSNDKWYHLAATKIGGKIYVYVNGELRSQGAVDEVNIITGFSLLGGCQYFRQDARYSEIRLWDHVRSSTELQNNIHAVSPDSEGLLVYLKCNEGEGNVFKNYGSTEKDFIANSTLTWEHGYRSDTWFD